VTNQQEKEIRIMNRISKALCVTGAVAAITAAAAGPAFASTTFAGIPSSTFAGNPVEPDPGLG
jgi:hypothetical protein